GSAGRSCTGCGPSSDVEGGWSPALLRTCAGGPFSLRRCLNSELALVQAEHHLFRFESTYDEGDPLGSPSMQLPCAIPLAHVPRSEGLCRPGPAPVIGDGRVPARKFEVVAVGQFVHVACVHCRRQDRRNISRAQWSLIIYLHLDCSTGFTHTH